TCPSRGLKSSRVGDLRNRQIKTWPSTRSGAMHFTNTPKRPRTPTISNPLTMSFFVMVHLHSEAYTVTLSMQAALMCSVDDVSSARTASQARAYRANRQGESRARPHLKPLDDPVRAVFGSRRIRDGFVLRRVHIAFGHGWCAVPHRVDCCFRALVHVQFLDVESVG